MCHQVSEIQCMSDAFCVGKKNFCSIEDSLYFDVFIFHKGKHSGQNMFQKK